MRPYPSTREARQRPLALESPAAIADRRLVVGRWWEAFRLVLLLAIGPAFLAFALTMARMPVWVVAKSTTLPNGSTERIDTDSSRKAYVTTTDTSGRQTMRAATAEEFAAATKISPPWNRERFPITAVLVVLTILAHGAAVVSLGVALGIWFRREWAIAISVGLFLLVAVGWPILYLVVDYPTYESRGLVMLSPIPAISLLLMGMHSDNLIASIDSWVAYWDLILVLLAVILSGLAIRTVDRRSRGDSSSRKEERPERPAIDSESRPASDEWCERIGPVASRHS